MEHAVIAGFARTPFTFADKGPLVRMRPDNLAAIALRGLTDKTGIDPACIEDVLMGCAYPEGEQGDNVARIASLLAGLPLEVGAATINRFCGSSMYSIHVAAGQIAIGAGDSFIAAGGRKHVARAPGRVQLLSQSPASQWPEPDGRNFRRGLCADGADSGECREALRRRARASRAAGARVPAKGGASAGRRQVDR